MRPEQLLGDDQEFVGREWVPQQVVEWIGAPSCPVLHITGEPGTGKTALCLWLAEPSGSPTPGFAPSEQTKLDEIRARVDASYFCSSTYAGQATSIDPRDFVRSVHAQLWQRLPVFGSFVLDPLKPLANVTIEVENIYGGDLAGLRIDTYLAAGRSVEDLFAVAIKDPLVGLCARRSDLQILLLIDGLDEAVGTTSPAIPELLFKLGPLRDNLKLIVASKHDQTLSEQLRSEFGTLRRIDLSSVPEQTEDVQRFISMKLPDTRVRGQAPKIVQRAGTNFAIARSLVEAPEETRLSLLELNRLPQPILDYYDSYFRALLPAVARRSGHPEDVVHRFCGYLAVAFSSLRQDTLAQWMHIQREAVALLGEYLSSILIFEPGPVAYRFRNQSIREALQSSSLDGSWVPPGGFDPRYWHEQIVEHYRSVPISEMDHYALLHLPEHYMALSNEFRALNRQSLADGFTKEATQLVSSPEYEESCRDRKLEGLERTKSLRAIAETFWKWEDSEGLEGLLAIVSNFRDPFARGLVIEMLGPLIDLSESSAKRLIVNLLSGAEEELGWLGLQLAAITEGTLREVIYLWILGDANERLREAAPYVFYATWGRDPHNRIAIFLRSLAARASLARPLMTRRIMEFISNLSVTSYVNHGHDLEVMREVSDVWRYILRDRMRVHWVNRSGFDRIIARNLASHLSKQVVNAALNPELQDVRGFFQNKEHLLPAFATAISCLDCSRPIEPASSAIEVLLGSEYLIARVLAAQVVALHSFVGHDSDIRTIEELFDSGNGRVRTWTLLAHTTPIPDIPVAWVQRLTRFTKTILDQNRTEFDSFDNGAVERLDVFFLPLGFALAAHGEDLGGLGELIQSADATVRGRVIASMGKLGLYRPRLASKALKKCIDVGEDPLAVSKAWGLFYLLHRAECDVFMDDEGLSELRPLVQAGVDVREMRFVLDLLGHYNNGINEGLRYPWMRDELLMPVFSLLARSSDEREFLRLYTRQVLGMLREADYAMIRWAFPKSS